MKYFQGVREYKPQSCTSTPAANLEMKPSIYKACYAIMKPSFCLVSGVRICGGASQTSIDGRRRVILIFQHARRFRTRPITEYTEISSLSP